VEALECISQLAACQGPNTDMLLNKGTIWPLIDGVLASSAATAETKDLAIAVSLQLIQTSPKAQTKVNAGKKIIHSVCDILCNEIEPIGVRSAAAELLNTMIAQCKPNCILVAGRTDWPTMVRLLERCSDYMIQAVIFEIAYRVSKNMNQGSQLVAAFAPVHSNCMALLTAPLQGQNFRTVTRNFLSLFNNNLGEHQRIFSAQCSDTSQWIDFGAVDMIIQPLNTEDFPQIVPYTNIRHVRLSDGQLMLWQHDDVQFSFVFSETDAEMLDKAVCGQIRAVSATGETGVKTSIAVMPITLAPPSQVVPKTPALEASPPAAVLAASPSQESSPVPTRTPRAASEDSPSFRVAQEPTPVAAFASPFRKVKRAESALTPSLKTGASPLVASFLQFGAALEDQLAQERLKAQQQNDATIKKIHRGFDKLVQQQNRDAASKLKRTASDEQALRDTAKEELARAKRSCTEALASIHKALETIATLEAATDHAGQQELMEKQAAERASFFRTFLKRTNNEE
jgi:hypothetical protein